MAEIPEQDAARLLDMLLAARDVLEFADGLTKEQFLSSRLHQNAIIRSLEVIGEAAGHVSPETTAALPKIPWQAITGMRHRLIHDKGRSRRLQIVLGSKRILSIMRCNRILRGR